MDDVAQALDRLRRAEVDYLELLTGNRDCPSSWPSDPPGAGYLGTRCQLLRAHDGQHRHRVMGTQTVVTWDD